MAGKEKPKEKKEKGFVVVTGKRKRAIARALVKPGSGKVFLNTKPLDLFPDEMLRLRMKEPLILAGNIWKGFDVHVTVKGGGIFGQADAVRQSIAKGLIEFVPELKATFQSYDRNLLAYDPRRTEPHKPGHSSWGPRRHKQRSKR